MSSDDGVVQTNLDITSLVVMLPVPQRKHDKVYQWKALRMISRESLPIFSKTAFVGDLEEAARGFFPTEVRSEQFRWEISEPQNNDDFMSGRYDVSMSGQASAIWRRPRAASSPRRNTLYGHRLWTSICSMQGANCCLHFV